MFSIASLARLAQNTEVVSPPFPNIQGGAEQADNSVRIIVCKSFVHALVDLKSARIAIRWPGNSVESTLKFAQTEVPREGCREIKQADGRLSELVTTLPPKFAVLCVHCDEIHGCNSPLGGTQLTSSQISTPIKDNKLQFCLRWTISSSSRPSDSIQSLHHENKSSDYLSLWHFGSLANVAASSVPQYV